MKKITMFTMGTRGDIQPYIFLSRALKKAGHEVSLGSHPCWQKFIEDSGIEFIQIGPDVDIEKEAASIRGKTSNPAISMLKTMKFIFNTIQKSSHEVFEACKDKDLIIVSHSQLGAIEAEVLGIPTVNVTLQTEMIAEKLKPLTLKDKIIGSIIGKQIAKPYNRIRKIYGLNSIKSLDEIISKQLNLIPISKYIIKQNSFWERQHVLTGYWYEDELEYKPDKKLEAFIKAGDKPIILALGAMAFEDQSQRDKLTMFVNAFRKTGYRAIIQGFQKTLKDYELPDSMIACGSVPHSWLFKQACFVIHHCGFGTAAATMIYGIPSLPIPHVLDQMGFAMQLYNTNISVKPLRCKDLSEESIIEAIKQMTLTYDEKKKNADDISEKVRDEKGLTNAVNLIEKILNKNGLTECENVKA